MKTIRIMLILLIAMLMAGTGAPGSMAQNVPTEPGTQEEMPAPPAASDEPLVPEPASPPDDEAGEQEPEAPTAGEPAGDDMLPSEGDANTEPASTTGNEDDQGEPAEEQPPVLEPTSTDDDAPIDDDDESGFVAAQSTEEFAVLEVEDEPATVSIVSASCTGAVTVRVSDGSFSGSQVHASALYTDVLINTADGPMVQDWKADLASDYTGGSKNYPFHFYIRNLTLTETTKVTFQAWATNGEPVTEVLTCGATGPAPTAAPIASIEIVEADCLGNVLVQIGEGTYSRSNTRLFVIYDSEAAGILSDTEYIQEYSGSGDYAYSFDPPELTAEMGKVTLFLEATGYHNASERLMDCTVVDEGESPDPDPAPCAPVAPEPTASGTYTPAEPPGDMPNQTSLPGSLDSQASGNMGQRLSFAGSLQADDCEPDVIPPAPDETGPVSDNTTPDPGDDDAPVVPPVQAPAPVVASENDDAVMAMPSTGTGTASHNPGGIAILLAGMGIVLAGAGSAVRKGAFAPGRQR